MPDALRILAIRFSSIGDILLTIPLLRAIRTRYPTAHLALRLWQPEVTTEIVPFDRILDVVVNGEAHRHDARHEEGVRCPL